MDKFYCNPAFIDSLISVNCSFIAQLQVTEISASVCGLNLPATKTGNVLNEAVKYIYIYMFLFHFEWSLRLLNSEQSAKPILTGCLFSLFFSDPHLIEKQRCSKRVRKVSSPLSLTAMHKWKEGKRETISSINSQLSHQCQFWKRKAAHFFISHCIVECVWKISSSYNKSQQGRQKLFARQTARNISHTASQRVQSS